MCLNRHGQIQIAYPLMDMKTHPGLFTVKKMAFLTYIIDYG